MKLLPCPSREPLHIYRMNSTQLRELSNARWVYPGVERLYVDNQRMQLHVE